MERESIYEKIKTLVAGSEVSLLNEQIWQQHKTIMFLEERVTAFERMMHANTQVTMDLAKELRFVVAQHSRVTSYRRTKTGRYGRSAGEVAKRWSEWKSLEEGGMSTFHIARLFKVRRESVDYAKRKGYSNATSSIPASLIGHELVALPPTRKGPRRQKELMRLAA
jgi:hypothetical protein